MSACSQKTFNDIFAPDRRVPDGSDVSFENRRTPILNPDGSIKRQVPAENMKMTGSDAASAPVTASNFETLPAVVKSPVVPVASNNLPPVVTNTTPYPNLASVPATPVVPTQDKVKSDFSTLSNQQQTTLASGKELSANKDATVMTSPVTGQIVAPVVPPSIPDPAIKTPASYSPDADLTAPPATLATTVGSTNKPVAAPVSTEKSDANFSAWLHNVFTSDKKAVPADTNIANARQAPAENTLAAPVTSGISTGNTMPSPSVSAAAAPLSVSVSDLKTPVPAKTANSPAPVSAPVNTASLPALPATKPDTTQQAVNVSNLPNISDMVNKQVNTVNLVQPKNYEGDEHSGYIEESRYSNSSSN